MDRIARVNSALLGAGTLAAALLVVVGGAVYLSEHGAQLAEFGTFRGPVPPFDSLSGIVASALSLSGEGLVLTGVLALVALQLLRVVLSGVLFVAGREWALAVMSLAVVAVLVFSLFRA